MEDTLFYVGLYTVVVINTSYTQLTQVSLKTDTNTYHVFFVLYPPPLYLHLLLLLCFLLQPSFLHLHLLQELVGQ